MRTASQSFRVQHAAHPALVEPSKDTKNRSRGQHIRRPISRESRSKLTRRRELAQEKEPRRENSSKNCLTQKRPHRPCRIQLGCIGTKKKLTAGSRTQDSVKENSKVKKTSGSTAAIVLASLATAPMIATAQDKTPAPGTVEPKAADTGVSGKWHFIPRHPRAATATSMPNSPWTPMAKSAAPGASPAPSAPTRMAVSTLDFSFYSDEDKQHRSDEDSWQARRLRQRFPAPGSLESTTAPSRPSGHKN